jgi:hypothetical protein
MTTNHAAQIKSLREQRDVLEANGATDDCLLYDLAADLLEIHDATGISLDNWRSARLFVEEMIEGEITENGV